MQIGLGGLFLWSFLMANAHDAELMLIPAVIPLCLAASPAHTLTSDASVPVALTVLGVHTAAMLLTIGIVSVTLFGAAQGAVSALKKSFMPFSSAWLRDRRPQLDGRGHTSAAYRSQHVTQVTAQAFPN